MTARDFPKALMHSAISEVLPDVFFVTGSADMPGKMPMKISRNMTILREGDVLTLVNSVRLTDAGLSELEKLGDIKHVIRLAGFHGMDDPFYKDRYGATVWSVDAPYIPGFDFDAAPYLTPDKVINGQSDLPISNAKLIEFTSATPREGLLHIDREGGILISGDCLQNWGKTDRYFNLPAKVIMKLMGFIKPYNIGPGWLKFAKPDATQVRAILDLEFNHVMPAHGVPVIENAKTLYQPRLAAV